MSNSTFAIVFGNLCSSIILTQGVGFYVLDGACKVFIHSGYVYFHSACDFAKRVPFKVQAEDAAGTAVIMFTGLGMTVIMVEGLDVGCNPALINEDWLGSPREMVA